MELTLTVIIVIFIISFICEYMDSTLGMGYGTTLTPLLLLIGFSPMSVVPAILVSQLLANILASIFHHLEGNVDFKPKDKRLLQLNLLIHPSEYIKGIRQSFPMHLKVGLLK